MYEISYEDFAYMLAEGIEECLRRRESEETEEESK